MLDYQRKFDGCEEMDDRSLEETIGEEKCISSFFIIYVNKN